MGIGLPLTAQASTVSDQTIANRSSGVVDRSTSSGGSDPRATSRTDQVRRDAALDGIPVPSPLDMPGLYSRAALARSTVASGETITIALGRTAGRLRG
jgi:hypothetical protein